MFLLDTCIISELTRRSPNINVITWLNSQSNESLYLSILTLGELRKGIALQDDIRRKDALNTSISAMLTRFSGRIVIIDERGHKSLGRNASRCKTKRLGSLSGGRVDRRDSIESRIHSGHSKRA